MAQPAPDRSLVPGRLGYNALPALPAADPRVGDEVELELATAAQLSELGRAGDAAVVPYLRLAVPFARIASLELDAVPLEAWRVTRATQDRLGAVASSGVAKGDLRLGARFTILPEGEASPALGVRLLVKTATGKDLADRRFIDAPAYAADALVGKTLPFALGPFEEVRLVGTIGFMAWQQGSGWQDDALTAAARLRLAAGERSRVELEWRAYWGYQGQDKPMVLGALGGHRLTRGVELVAAVLRGLTADAPPWEVRLGAVFRLPARELPLVGRVLDPPPPAAPPAAVAGAPASPVSDPARP